MARNGKKTPYNGITFDSETECKFYKLLERAKKSKLILDFEYEPTYLLLEGGWENKRGDKQEPITYLPDFLVTNLNGEKFLVDAKGGDMHEEVAKIKKKMLEYQRRDLIVYFVAESPNYLGCEWIETTPHRNMLQKLKSAYKKEYPTITRKTKASPKLNREKWDKYMSVECVEGLFYTYGKVYTKKELKSK